MNDSKIRAFLAIDIDYDLVKKMEYIQNDFKKINADIKYVKSENFHFTLKFFGNIDENMVEKLQTKIKQVLNQQNPFEIAIKGMGSFPNNDYIKVIWFGVDKNPILNNLYKNLDDEFKKLGFKKEKDYNPHLTIGRMKTPKNKDEVKNKITDYNDIEIGKMNLNKISLKKSELTPNGPIYSDINIFKL